MAENLTKGGSTRCPHLARADVLSHRTANSGSLLLHRPLPALPSIISSGVHSSARRTVSAKGRAMPPLPAPPARLRRLDRLGGCDASAGIVTTIRDTVSCSWIFYSNSSGSTPAEGAAPPAEPDPDLDSMHMMLDPHLRPISPDLANDESKRIFDEHKQLAQEYLKIQTELAYLSKHKSELEEQMDDEELRQKREIIQLENEKDSLIKLYCTLKKQLARADNDGWMLPEERPLD